MTSVPKPLKFLRPHFGTLKSYFETMPESELKVSVITSGHPAEVCCILVWHSVDAGILLFCRSTWLTYCQC
ncbi:26S proteasome non-ATPase regulatory subunit 2 homolog A [Zea mays]|uniref:26S proteasome non-ATPase regulatory subunit 2 homolog A n=1 Tax=Zea mays TaxID=4577 RepID=A0A1D6H0T8_MAIZE|nr:26S proteasome non-ATPase regulatory subunit 2 homolog A [Zea mays]